MREELLEKKSQRKPFPKMKEDNQIRNAMIIATPSRGAELFT